MPKILVISSHVAFGSVGLSATTAPLLRYGIEVVALPTVVLSNHPGYRRFAGLTVEPDILQDMTAALDANGWLADLDAIFSGYLPSERHVTLVGELVARMRQLNPTLLYSCDPVLGDDPKGLYIDGRAATAMRETLVGLADVLIPNRFELAWLSGREVASIDDAVVAARTFSCPKICATSVPTESGKLANVFVSNSEHYVCRVEKIEHAPHGVGDLFSGFLTAGLLQRHSDVDALHRATEGVRRVLAASQESDHLLLASVSAA